MTTQVVEPRVRAGADVDRRQHPAADARARRGAALRASASLLLVGVALFGVVVNGSRRWLNLGVARIQPSELMKIALPLMLAWYFQKFEGRIGWKDFALAAVLIVVPVWLIKRQPDLGTALLIAASGFYVLFLAGLSWKIIVGLVGAGGRRRRRSSGRTCTTTSASASSRSSIPTRDPLGAGYHSTQASIAHRLGRRHRQGLAERHADAPRLPARAAHRFHLRRVRRGVRPDRQRGAARPLPAADRPRR